MGLKYVTIVHAMINNDFFASQWASNAKMDHGPLFILPSWSHLLHLVLRVPLRESSVFACEDRLVKGLYFIFHLYSLHWRKNLSFSYLSHPYYTWCSSSLHCRLTADQIVATNIEFLSFFFFSVTRRSQNYCLMILSYLKFFSKYYPDNVFENGK